MIHEHIKNAKTSTEHRPDCDLYFNKIQQLLDHFKLKNNLFG